MAVNPEIPFASATANGVAVFFSFSFTVLDSGDLVVTGTTGGVTTPYVLGTDYTVTGLGVNPGSINFVTAPANGIVITMFRLSALGREITYQTLGDLLSGTLNEDFDRIWYALQEMRSRSDGALRLPYPETVAELPSAANRANKVLAFDVSGNPLLTVLSAGTAGALALQLADTTVATNNAGMVGYNKLLSYAAGTVGAALLAFGSTASASVGAGLVAFSPAFATTYGTATVGARVNKAGHPSNTNTILGFGIADDHLLTGTVGYRNTIAGVGAGAAIGSAVTAGGSNCYYGFGTGAANTEGSGNCFFGALAASFNTTGDHNNVFGYRSLDKHTTGAQNNVFGFEGMFSLISGNNNCGFGESVLFNMTTGNGNVAMGMNALYSKTTGDFSVSIGFQSSFAQTTATQNTSIGKEALYSFTTQGGNTAVGYEVLRGVAGGINNTAMGAQALTAINGGTFNTAYGWNAGLRLTTAGSCVFLGQQAGAFVTTGDENVLIGPSAGSGIVAGTRNVAIGSGTTSVTNRSNTIAIGYNAQPNGDNQVVLGDTNINAIRAQVTTITALSDARDKADRHALGIGLGFINAIEINGWTWAQRSGSSRNGSRDFGVIAQQLLEVQERFDAQWLRLVDTTDPEHLEATPGKLLFPLIVAVQELSAQVEALRQAA